MTLALEKIFCLQVNIDRVHNILSLLCPLTKMYKIVVITSIFVVICLVNGEYNPNSEIERVDTVTDPSVTELKNMLKKIADETIKLKELLESTKKNMADGPKSNSNINKLLAMPKEVANLTHKLQSTINALENKELLA